MTTPQQLEEEMLSNPVRSLQYMLRRLAGKYDFLPQLALDGIFGERTLEAVMLFQRELAPPVTGVVDQRTWDAIRDAWIGLERESAPPRTLRIFPGEKSPRKPKGRKSWRRCVLFRNKSPNRAESLCQRVFPLTKGKREAAADPENGSCRLFY